MRAHQLLEPMHTQTPTHGFLHAVAAHGRHRLPLVRGREQRLAVLQDVAAHAELVQAKLAEQAAERVALPLHLGCVRTGWKGKASWQQVPAMPRAGVVRSAPRRSLAFYQDKGRTSGSWMRRRSSSTSTSGGLSSLGT